MNFKMQEGEKALKQGKGNRSTIINTQAGGLFLTNQRLVFVGHGNNIGEGAIAINLEDISSYDKASTFMIFFPIPIPNAFKVVLQNGKKYKFTVLDRQQWLQELEKAMNQ